jgi:cell division protein FtsN
VVKDYARKRNRFDLNKQQFSNNTQPESNPSESIDSIDSKWLFLIGIGMLVLFLLLMISMKMVSSVEKTHQKVKATPKLVSQPDFDFYNLLSGKKPKDTSLKSNNLPKLVVSSEASESNNSQNVSEYKFADNKDDNANIKKQDAPVAKIKTKTKETPKNKEKTKVKVKVAPTPEQRIKHLKLGSGPYHITVPRFKSYKSANSVRAELILNNLQPVIERKGGGYQVALPPASNKDELKGQMDVLASVGVVDYRVS